MNDPLDIAYIAIGIRDAQKERPQDRLPGGGELEAIGAIIAHSVILDTVWDEVGDDFAGVWTYEVAEVFGYRFACHLMDGGANTKEEAESMVRDIVGEVETEAGRGSQHVPGALFHYVCDIDGTPRVEVRGVIDNAGSIEHASEQDAQFFGVYVRGPEAGDVFEWVADFSESGAACGFADFYTTRL